MSYRYSDARKLDADELLLFRRHAQVNTIMAMPRPTSARKLLLPKKRRYGRALRWPKCAAARARCEIFGRPDTARMRRFRRVFIVVVSMFRPVFLRDYAVEMI